jgi:hypothetical protein
MDQTKSNMFKGSGLGSTMSEHQTRLISSASGMERGKVFYRPMDWLGSCDPMTHYNYDPDSSSGLDD